MKFPLFPPQASTIAREVDLLYLALIGLCGLVLLGILIVMVYFVFKYRRGKPAIRTPFTRPTIVLELTWTFIPLVLFMGLFTWGAVIYNDQQKIPPGAIDLNIVGKQWMWKIQHPNGQREINELHVPVGKIVKLTLASQDVIHSFYLPAFRIKQDVVPGRFTTEWFKATKTGTYHIFCAEYCGKDHSRMRGKVVVMAPADYDQWLTRGEPHPPLVEAGERLFLTLGCSGCHLRSAVVRAPPLEGIYGRRVPLQDGRIVVADEAYLRDSILLPQRDVAAGYQPVMPSYQGQLSEEQIFELISYLKNLGAKTPEEAQ
jgi:cytochrome c oxidase subunit 2